MRGNVYKGKAYSVTMWCFITKDVEMGVYMLVWYWHCSISTLLQFQSKSRLQHHFQLHNITVFVSVLKERLDFSCAMFGPTGGLVANGPHVPMHLGSMQETVKYQVAYNTGLLSHIIHRVFSLAFDFLTCVRYPPSDIFQFLDYNSFNAMADVI